MQFLELFLSNEIFSKTIMKIPFSYPSLPFSNEESEMLHLMTYNCQGS